MHVESKKKKERKNFSGAIFDYMLICSFSDYYILKLKIRFSSYAIIPIYYYTTILYI